MAPSEPVVVYDLSSIRFERSAGGTAVSMTAASGEVLAVIDVLAHQRDADIVFACCEHALAAARPRRGGRRVRVGLYNPYTAQISYGAGVDGVVYGDGAAVALDAGGTVGMLTADGLELDGRCLVPVTLSAAGVSRALVDSAGGERRRTVHR